MGMGYQGYAKFYGTGPAVAESAMVVLATGASVNLVLEPIFSTAVWGAGWYNAADAAHYADNALRYEGNIDVELQMGANGMFWDYLASFIVASRAYPRSLEISPDGAHVYKYLTSGGYNVNYDNYGCWCRSANFSTSEGSFVTCSLGVVAIFRTESDPIGGSNYSNYSYILQKTGVTAGNCTNLANTNPLNPAGGNVDPIPYWKTNAQLSVGSYPGAFGATVLPQSGLETVEWSVDITNNEKILYTCSGSRLPRAVLMGPMSVSGNVTLYNPLGVFDPIIGPNGTGTLTAPYAYAENTWFQIGIQKPAATPGTVYIEIPAAVIESDDYSITGADAVTNRSFSIKGLGGRCDSTTTLPPCIISDYDGALPSS
jgi:hypothetical protein